MYTYTHVYTWFILYTYTYFSHYCLRFSLRVRACHVCIRVLGCNNGGGGWNFPDLKRLFLKWIGTRKRLFSEFSFFSPYLCGSKNFFPRHILLVKLSMHIWSCSWALRIYKKIWIQTCFGPVTVDSVEVSNHFAFWRHRFKLATVFSAPKNCTFWGASF